MAASRSGARPASVQCGAVPAAPPPPSGSSTETSPPRTDAIEFNLAQAFDVLTESLADRECVVWRDRRLSYGQLQERSKRLASYLHGQGLGVRAERTALANWESGQDMVALALYNGNEYLEGMLGCYASRTAPFNVNYRYVGEELRYLLNDARPRAMILHSSLAPTLAEVLPTLDVAARRAAPGRGRVGSPPPPRGGLVRGGVGRGLARRAHRSTPPPTTSTSSTRGARPACPRACCGASTTSSWPPWVGGRWAPGRGCRATRG